MPIQQFKPTSPGRRGASGYTFTEITKKRPEKSLTVTLKAGNRGHAAGASPAHRLDPLPPPLALGRQPGAPAEPGHRRDRLRAADAGAIG